MERIDRPRWRKSSYSGSNGGDCVEVADQAGRVLVRDTKDRSGAVLGVGAGAWRRFVGQVKRALARRLWPIPQTLAGALSCRECPRAVFRGEMPGGTRRWFAAFAALPVGGAMSAAHECVSSVIGPAGSVVLFAFLGHWESRGVHSRG